MSGFAEPGWVDHGRDGRLLREISDDLADKMKCPIHEGMDAEELDMMRKRRLVVADIVRELRDVGRQLRAIPPGPYGGTEVKTTNRVIDAAICALYRFSMRLDFGGRWDAVIEEADAGWIYPALLDRALLTVAGLDETPIPTLLDRALQAVAGHEVEGLY